MKESIALAAIALLALSACDSSGGPEGTGEGGGAASISEGEIAEHLDAVGAAVAGSDGWPNWNEGTEFRAPRDASRVASEQATGREQ